MNKVSYINVASYFIKNINKYEDIIIKYEIKFDNKKGYFFVASKYKRTSSLEVMPSYETITQKEITLDNYTILSNKKIMFYKLRIERKLKQKDFLLDFNKLENKVLDAIIQSDSNLDIQLRDE